MRQTALWYRHGLDLSIAINLSPILLERGELVQEISELQQQHGLRAEQIVFEVTESSLLRDLAIALGVLTRLRLRGFRLSLDDYGTGFSSMQQLARIPFTELKIDRTFVHGAHERDSLQVILRSALEMASQLGIETVAEGVECLQDWRLLRQLRLQARAGLAARQGDARRGARGLAADAAAPPARSCRAESRTPAERIAPPCAC